MNIFVSVFVIICIVHLCKYVCLCVCDYVTSGHYMCVCTTLCIFVYVYMEAYLCTCEDVLTFTFIFLQKKLFTGCKDDQNKRKAMLKVLKTVEFNISDKGMYLVLSNSIENLVAHVKLILRTMGCIQDCFKSLTCCIFSQ